MRPPICEARLPQARFDELSRLADTLQHNEVELRTRRQDRSTALAQELAKKLSEKTLEQLREENCNHYRAAKRSAKGFRGS